MHALGAARAPLRQDLALVHSNNLTFTRTPSQSITLCVCLVQNTFSHAQKNKIRKAKKKRFLGLRVLYVQYYSKGSSEGKVGEKDPENQL